MDQELHKQHLSGGRVGKVWTACQFVCILIDYRCLSLLDPEWIRMDLFTELNKAALIAGV